MSDNENTNKDFEVVTGDGSELELSEVYEHLNVATPKPKEIKKNIIIPEVKKKKEDKDKKKDS